MKEWQPFKQMPQPLQVTVIGDALMLDAVEMGVEDEVWTITRYVDAAVPHLVLLLDAAQRDMVLGKVQAAAEPFGVPEIRELQLKDIDWVSQVQKDFPPFAMGPFYVHGSHAKGTTPLNHYPLLIDAAAAFGTGEHATTAGCLLALAQEKKKRPHTPDVLDMGCGTAILAIGAARLWKDTHITACDNDPVAVKVSAHNLRVNRIGARSRAFVSDGYKSARVRDRQYPVIVANILAKPLMKMAHRASQRMAPGSVLILSGLLRSQEAMVLSAHRAQGRYLSTRIRRGQWSVLVLR